jgi:hypothetical protein
MVPNWLKKKKKAKGWKYGSSSRELEALSSIPSTIKKKKNAELVLHIYNPG